jgi:antitoxin (DNA-binding transcriptional repressor) of toxin-antitoxin stability system
MKKIARGAFKTRCLMLMEEVRATREPLVITKRGEPVAKQAPADNPPRGFIGRLKGRIRIVGDIESPVGPPEAWESLR